MIFSMVRFKLTEFCHLDIGKVIFRTDIFAELRENPVYTPCARLLGPCGGVGDFPCVLLVLETVSGQVPANFGNTGALDTHIGSIP